MHRVTFLIILSVLLLDTLFAQEIPGTFKTPEEGFALMRQYAADNMYENAKQIGYSLLEENPEYHDVSLYMARIYGWEAEYDSAYSILERISIQEPSLLEASRIRVDLAYWENDWLKLEAYAEAYLETDPESPEVRKKYLLAKSQSKTGQDVPEIMVAYSYDHFREPYRRSWHMLTVGGIIPLKPGLLSPYINGGYHPGITGHSTDIQFNLDSYVHLGKLNYGLAGYGFSPDGISNYLPRHRAVLELWQVLPVGFAMSAGMRYFYWGDHFTFLTFSGEKYAGDYWVSLRNYLFFKEYGISGSWYLSARRYFANKFNYISATLGLGTAPDEPLLVVSDLDRLSALSLRMDLSRMINYKLRMHASAGYAYEKYADDSYRNRFSLRVGVYIRLHS